MKDAISKKQKINEKKFEKWIDLENGTRKYWFEVQGKQGYKAIYVKIVNANEITVKFYQEIYNEKGELIEIHEKFPVDKGHKKIGG